MVACLDNGLARKPPMGWMSWARFACETDCQLYPSDCISEKLYKDMSDHLAADGYLAAGYEYVNVDDCWAEKARDPVTQQLVADGRRFPGGIAHLADYAHDRGLKFGIYGDIGTLTCGGYPGFSQPDTELTNYFLLDMITFSNWGIDSLKVDGCYASTDSFQRLYPRLGGALNYTGRPILYGCSWPAYQIGEKVDYESIERTCNLWRNFDDIEDSWQSVLSIIDFYAKNQDLFSAINGPGGWFDPDMLIIGNFGLSLEQSRAQMAFWSLWSAPLLMSNDLRSISTDHRAILLNSHLIAVDQDELGVMGRKVYDQGGIEIWAKAMTPVINGKYHSFAVVYFNRRTLGSVAWVSQPLNSILNGTATHSSSSSPSFASRLSSSSFFPFPAAMAAIYNVYDLFDDGHLVAKLGPSDNLTLLVNPSGSVRMVKLVPIKQE
ncbi:Alpha-N-acetylgalactosaminidase [Halotydeus destructor]|nr:Alpha-N-acetylgalactosaminidase [Halotydeus destructor]